MDTQELRRALLTNDLTGIQNRRAWEEAEKKANIASIDADSLKWLNDNLSPDAGDGLLKAVAARMADVFPAGDIFHISGDEFIAMADDAQALRAGMARVQELLDNDTITETKPDGTVITKTGLAVTTGYGKDKSDADQDLKREKRDRETRGERAGRGEQPPGVVRREPARVPAADRAGQPGDGDAVGRQDVQQRGARGPGVDEGPQFSRSASKDQRELILQHNLTADNLLNALRIGGIPVPSLAVTKVDSPLTNFGDITLLGNADMATPGGDTKVFGADIYSPRYPRIEYKLDRAVLKGLNEKLKPFSEGREVYSSEISNIDDLVSNKAFKKFATDKLGESEVEKVRFHDLKGVASGLLAELGAEERIFQGFTYSGSRRYIPHTLDNVVKILKKELRGGENFNYGVGSVRAQYTPQFRSLASIRKEKGRIVTKEEFEKVKKEVDDEFFKISDALRSFHPSSNSFGFNDSVSMMMSDAAKMGLPRAMKENGFDDVSPEAMEEVRDYLNKLRNLPTEYFETKITRAVDVGEFAAAVIPDDTDQRVVSALRNRGVKTFTYKAGDEKDRARVTRQAAQEAGDDVLFSRASVPEPSTVTRVQSAVTDLLGGKQLANSLGRVVATTAADIKTTWEPLIGKNVQIGSEGEAGVAQGFYDPRTKTVFLIADNINQGDEGAVLAHELMHKHGQAVLGEAGWNRLHGMIGTWKDAKEGSDERRVYDYAAGKVEAVGEELSTQELFPYAVEGAIKQGIKPSLQAKRGTVANWLESVRQSLKSVWGRITGKPETFRAQDLVDLSFGIAQMEDPENAALRGALARSTQDQTDTPAFRKWFGDSKVVDAEGKPLVVYRGGATEDWESGAEITAFRSKNGPWSGFFTSSPEVASRFANAQYEMTRNGGVPSGVFPVYLSLARPLEVDAGGKPAREFQIDASVLGKTDHPIRQKLLSGDYDGLILRNTQDEGDVFVPLHPKQIKSAIGNRGTFDPSSPDIRFSRGNQPPATGGPGAGALSNAAKRVNSPWRDTTGRLQFAPGQWLYDKIGQAASPVLNWKYLQLKAASPELRRMLRDMKLQVEKAQETAAAVAGEAFKLTDTERAMVSDLVEKEVQAGVTPPAHAVQLAAMINEAMGRQTDELIRLGMLTKDAAEKWRGQYLPRYYETKLGKKLQDVWADSIGKMFRQPRAMQGIRGKHLKGRGLYQTISENQLANYEALGWEVRDTDYQPGLTGDGTVQVWRDFTRQERDKMGEIRDAGFRFVMGYMQTQKDIALGQLYEGLAANADMSSRTETEKFSAHVPDTKVTGTGAHVYGRLAGRWVSPETMSQLSKGGEEANEALQMYRKAMSYWKQGKTSLNPVAHANNVMSNVTMAHFAGVSYWRPDSYVDAIRDLVKKAPMVKEAKDAGLFLGSMSETELMNTMPEQLRVLAGRQDGAAAKAGQTVWDLMTFWLSTPMGKAYQAEDSFFRYLIYRDARQRGLEPSDAVDYAQKYIFTYDDLPKGARMIRDFGMPFFAYTYKAIPALLHTALTHPDRLAAPAAVLWAVNAAAYAMSMDDDDDWLTKLKRYVTDSEFREKVREAEKLERRYLPEWMKGTTSLGTPKTIRMGMDEVTALPLFMDMSRMMPGGDLFDVNPNAGGIPLPQPITPNHPFFTLSVGLLANKDLFLGKDLTDANDTSAEKAEKRMGWLWRQMSPAIAVNNYHWQRWMNAASQATGGELKYVPDVIGGDSTGVGRDGLPVQPKYAALQTVGIKLRPIDLDVSEQIEANQRRKMIRDIDAEIRGLKRLSGKGAINDAALEKEMEKAQEKKQRLREGLTVDGDEVE